MEINWNRWAGRPELLEAVKELYIESLVHLRLTEKEVIAGPLFKAKQAIAKAENREV